MSYVTQELCDEIGKLKQALAEKDMSEDLTTYQNSDGHWISEQEHRRIVAEKDREITHLQDVYMKQRVKLEDAYQQLMEKAVDWASYIMTIDDETWETYKDAKRFLASPEVQAWKEHKP